MSKKTIIIGAGFYGLSIALFLYDELGVKDIEIIEKESEAMARASYVNQARVHKGYHYPRSLLTGYRSAVNFPRFVDEYRDAIVSNFDKYYAIARQLSKVNTRQFYRFAEKIGAEVDAAPGEIKQLFNDSLVEGVFKVKEYAFNSHKLRDVLLRKIAERPGVVLHFDEKVLRINGDKCVVTDRSEYYAEYIINCTYSNINTLHRASKLPPVDLKHEVTEMCIVKLPDELKKFSVTLMDGPFFSIMPFPSKGLWTLSHVRYTPHTSWIDTGEVTDEYTDPHSYLGDHPITSNYKQMYNDVIRYIPALKTMEHVESIVEVKTVLVKSEGDDSRPILFKNNHGMEGYLCVMGGKLDNIYDVFEALEEVYGKKEAK